MPSPIRFIAPRRADRQHPSGSNHRILYPLDFVYAQAGVPGPGAKKIAPSRIPLPYRSLLMHERGMTLTLEEHFGCRIMLRTLSTFCKGRWYFRRVLLVREDSGRPVGMGAIRMNLEALRPRIRAQILRNDVPLGRILSNGHVGYRSRPRIFLGITPNSEMMGVFWMRKPVTLYGRQTEATLGGRKIADIIEVLGPA